MKIIIATPEEIAKSAAAQYKKLLSEKPNAVLGLATGSTPLGLYGELARMCKEGEITFKNARSFNLDEYVGLEPTHDQSYRYFMDTNLFQYIDLPMEKTMVPSGFVKSDEEAALYDEAIDNAGGIDLQLLGVGPNGHIAFNEPGTPLESLTHLVELTESTRRANSRFFASLDEVPTHAVSMGMQSIMHAREIIMIALGENKAETMRNALLGPITPENPASILRLHPNVTFYLDHEAAKYL